MRVLGIDPGLADTGWALLEVPEAGSVRLAASGLIATRAGVPLHRRLRALHRQLARVIADGSPHEAAIEELFFVEPRGSVAGTLQARGVILLALAQADLDVWPYNPRAVKLALTGSGRALKPQVQRMLQRHLCLPAVLSPDDVADAAAIGLCHARSRRFKGLKVLERVGGRA